MYLFKNANQIKNRFRFFFFKNLLRRFLKAVQKVINLTQSLHKSPVLALFNLLFNTFFRQLWYHNGLVMTLPPTQYRPKAENLTTEHCYCVLIMSWLLFTKVNNMIPWSLQKISVLPRLNSLSIRDFLQKPISRKLLEQYLKQTWEEKNVFHVFNFGGHVHRSKRYEPSAKELRKEKQGRFRSLRKWRASMTKNGSIFWWLI